MIVGAVYNFQSKVASVFFTVLNCWPLLTLMLLVFGTNESKAIVISCIIPKQAFFEVNQKAVPSTVFHFQPNLHYSCFSLSSVQNDFRYTQCTGSLKFNI